MAVAKSLSSSLIPRVCALPCCVVKPTHKKPQLCGDKAINPFQNQVRQNYGVGTYVQGVHTRELGGKQLLLDPHTNKVSTGMSVCGWYQFCQSFYLSMLVEQY